MKTIILVFGMLCALLAYPQQNASKNDIIMTSDGELLQVRVTKVTENAISFNYPGETVVNEIRPNRVDKIVFASGRTQNFGGSTTGAGTAGASANTTLDRTVPVRELPPPAPPYQENLMSIVPLDFQRNGRYDKTLAGKATEYVIGLMSNKVEAQGIEVQEMGKAIEKLIDSGFNYDKLRESSPKELRGALGAEYLLYITIKEDEKKAGPSDLMSGAADKNTQMERSVNLRLYGAQDEVESFEVDFSENVFVKNAANDSSLLASGKWKSSLRYLADQLFAARVFTD